MRITTNLIICVFAVQFTVSCAASLSEQCKQLKTASYSSEIYEQRKKENDPIKSRKLLAASFAEKARNLKNLELSDPNLKSIQTKLIESKEGMAKRLQGEKSLEDYQKFSQTYDDVEKELDAACSKK